MRPSNLNSLKDMQINGRREANGMITLGLSKRSQDIDHKL